ncbi:MAG: hypothetical protein CL728_04035 [Chloroflexi bacterium]|jgi:MOSC domain-containing protein YiiM|nr:hypothetical protein [Chloroflexota bacterium]|tara:strand:+ start:8498 stop:8917 length:420 start_codon:yes stop_codon:yes gene_type:complete
MGIIRSLAVNQGKQKPMLYEKKIKIIKNFGIEGDRFSKFNDSRQIMIVDGKLYDKYDLKTGVLRENILVDNIDLNSCQEGQIFSINDSLQIKISLVKDACASVSYNDPDVIKQLQGNMYAFATPLQTGYISIKDKMKLL